MAFDAVTVPLASGAFQVFNLQGSLDVIADVNGYYRAAAIAPVVASRRDEGPLVINSTEREILSISATRTGPFPYRGTMVVHYSVNVEQDDAGAVVECDLGDSIGFPEPSQRWESPGSPGGSGDHLGIRNLWLLGRVRAMGLLEMLAFWCRRADHRDQRDHADDRLSRGGGSLDSVSATLVVGQIPTPRK